MKDYQLPYQPQDVFQPLSEDDFLHFARLLYRFQYENNAVYHQYCDLLPVDKENVTILSQIPFLPISFFKTHAVMTTDFVPQISFSSSGTVSQIHSYHHLKDVTIYEKSFTKGFEYFYGQASDYVFLALLPNYLEREGSSLIYMMDSLITRSARSESGFYLYNYQKLYEKLQFLKQNNRKTILIGVTYALLDFVEKYQIDFPELIIIETGGMKGKRKEMVKENLYAILKSGFGVKTIHSEYGMCELLSQAYSCADNLFSTPPWMKVLPRDEKNPLSVLPTATSGAINVIDLANFYSCAFIATDDLGRFYSNSLFEVLGRMDNSEIRGCNLLIMND